MNVDNPAIKIGWYSQFAKEPTQHYIVHGKFAATLKKAVAELLFLADFPIIYDKRRHSRLGRKLQASRVRCAGTDQYNLGVQLPARLPMQQILQGRSRSRNQHGQPQRPGLFTTHWLSPSGPLNPNAPAFQRLQSLNRR
jgi:hypothetical protein